MSFNNNAGSEENFHTAERVVQGQNDAEFDFQTTPDYSYRLADNGQSKWPTDWTFSLPAWPESPSTESPPSSAEAHQDPSWNPFDQSFGSIQISTNNSILLRSSSYLGCPPLAYQAAYNSSNLQKETQLYVSLASINERTTLDDTEEDDDIPQPETSLSATTSPSTNYQPRQPAWGFSKSSRRSLTLSNSPKKPIMSSKRRNSVDQDPRLSNQRTHTESTPRPRSTQSLGSGESHSNTFPSASCSAAPQASLSGKKLVRTTMKSRKNTGIV